MRDHRAAKQPGIGQLQPAEVRAAQVRLVKPRAGQLRIAQSPDVPVKAKPGQNGDNQNQCGRADLPELLAPRRLADHLAAARGTVTGPLRLVLAPHAGITARQLPGKPTAIEVLIGPEGGLGDDELALAGLAGYTGLRLGPRVLRTETAAAAAIAVLQTLHGDLG